MKSLVDLVFSDLFLEDPIETSWYKETPDSLITQAIPSDYMEEIYGLREKLSSHKGNPDFKVEWPNKSGFRMRVSRNEVSDSKIVFVCRRYRLMPGKLRDLGVPDAIAEQLLLPSLTKGLVIFLGKAGSGKTTTASSFIKEKLTLQGGVCWTVENPIELPMQGMHGKGRCYQTEVDDDAKMGESSQVNYVLYCVVPVHVCVCMRPPASSSSYSVCEVSLVEVELRGSRQLSLSH